MTQRKGSSLDLSSVVSFHEIKKEEGVHLLVDELGWSVGLLSRKRDASDTQTDTSESRQ